MHIENSIFQPIQCWLTELFGGDVAQAPAGQLPATGESQAPLSLWAAVMAGLGSLMVGLGLKKEREAQ